MSDDNEDKPRPANVFPEAKLIAKTFGTDFNAVICKRKAIADIRELILDYLKPGEPVVYKFHLETLWTDICEISENLKNCGYAVQTTPALDDSDEHSMTISLPSDLVEKIYQK